MTFLALRQKGIKFSIRVNDKRMDAIHYAQCEYAYMSFAKTDGVVIAIAIDAVPAMCIVYSHNYSD